MSETPVGPPVHTEGTAPGVRLNSYTDKKVSDDGTYVVITRHSEAIELIPQPLTPEELAEQKKTERSAMMLAGGLGVLFFAFMGWIVYQDEKQNRRNEDAPAET